MILHWNIDLKTTEYIIITKRIDWKWEQLN